MNFLLLGYGSIGQRHTAILRNLGHRVMTVDPDEGQGADWKSYSVESEMAWDGLLDCTPPDVRAVWGAPGRYRAYFIEKPLNTTVQMTAMPVQMGFSYRWHSRLEEFVNILHQHQIQSMHIVGGQYLQGWHSVDYRTRQYHGVVIDSLPHSIYIARWILGELELVGAQVSKVSDLEVNVPDVAAVILRGPENQPAILYADYLRNPRSFYIEAQTNQGLYRWEFAPKEADAMYQRQMEQFVRVCQGDKQSGYPNLADGIAVQRILDGITLRSDSSDQEQSLGHRLPEM